MMLRLPYELLALALAIAVVGLAAWVLDTSTDRPTTLGLLGLVAGGLAVLALIKRVVWRIQRRADASQ